MVRYILIVAQTLTAAGSSKPSLHEQQIINSHKQAFPADDLDEAEKRIRQFRKATGEKLIPTRDRLLISSLEFRIASRRVWDAIARSKGSSVPQRLEDNLRVAFERYHNAILDSIHTGQASGRVGTLLKSVSHEQQLQMEMSQLLRELGLYQEAVDRLDDCESIYKTIENEAQEQVVVYVQDKTRRRAEKKSRVEVFGLIDDKSILKERIALMEHWVQEEPNNKEVGQKLTKLYGQYATNHPTDAFAFYYAAKQMDKEGQLDIDKLRSLLDGCSDKTHKQWLSSSVSFGNILLDQAHLYDEAAKRYEDVLDRGGPGKARLPELYAQLGEAHEKLGHYDTSLEYYKKAQQLTDSYQHLPLAIERVKRMINSRNNHKDKDGNRMDFPNTERRRVILYTILAMNMAILAVLLVVKIARRRRSAKDSSLYRQE